MTIIDFKTGLDYHNVQDANQVAENEDFSSFVVEFSVDGLLMTDLSGRYTLWNPAMEKLTGLKKEQVIGKHWLELFPGFKGGPVEKAFLDTIAGNIVEVPPFPFETPGTGYQGWAEQRNTPVYNEKGEIVGMLAVARDVTRWKQEHDRLVEENRQLRERLKPTS